MNLKTKESFFTKLCHAMELSARAQVLNELKGMSPRMLKDAGFSPELLEKGVSAWPWRMEEPTMEEISPVAAIAPVLTKQTRASEKDSARSKSKADFDLLTAPS